MYSTQAHVTNYESGKGFPFTWSERIPKVKRSYLHFWRFATFFSHNGIPSIDQLSWKISQRETVEEIYTYVMYSRKVDRGSVAWVSMCLYSSTSLRVHFSTIVVVCNGDGSALKTQPKRVEGWEARIITRKQKKLLLTNWQSCLSLLMKWATIDYRDQLIVYSRQIWKISSTRKNRRIVLLTPTTSKLF